MSWNRWKARVLGGLITLAAGGGCNRQLFLEPGDYHDAVRLGLPKHLETNVHDTILAARVDAHGAGPASVYDPERPGRNMTLKECIAIALEQGSTGGGNASGIKSDQLPFVGDEGDYQSSTDSIRVFALDPARTQANLEQSASRFDARWITSMSWQKVDQPVAAQFLSFQQQRDAANFSTSLVKPLPTGGIAGITFSTDYSKFAAGATQTGFVNPNYTPRLQFSFEQPLLQFFGVEINQMRNSGVQSSLIQGFAQGQSRDGILIARIKHDRTRTSFDARVNLMLVNVEAAYWNLYAAYYNMYAQEEGLRQAQSGYQFEKVRVDTGTDASQQLDQSEAQVHRFRGSVYTARAQVLDRERQLRGMLNLRSDDGYRLVPVDEPNLAPYEPNFYEAANEAMAHRPELMFVRQDLKILQMNLQVARNLRRPNLNSFAQYDIAGLGTRLDGPEFTDTARTRQGNAFTSFGNNQFNSWTLGLRLDVPLGFREANAQVRKSQLDLTRRYYDLRHAELVVLELVVDQWRRVYAAYQQIPPKRSERMALQTFLAKTKTSIDAGKFTANDFFNYLQVQQQLAAAIASEFQAIGEYNAALAGLEYAKGTIMRYNNITVGDGPLPPWVGKRAADHIRERTDAALEMRQRPVVLGGGNAPDHTVGPAVGTPFSETLLPLAEKREPVADPVPVPKNGQQLPPPKTMPNGDKPGTGALGQPWPGQLTGMGAGAAMPLGRPTPLPKSGAPAAGGEFFQNEGTVTLPPRTPFGAAAPSPTGRVTDVPPIGGARPTRSSGLPPLPTLPSGNP